MPEERFPSSQDQPPGERLIPSGFMRVVELLHPSLDRRLGYPGDRRFVCFCCDPHGDEVMWRDACAYGLASSGWSFWMDQIAPLADDYEVNLGSSLHEATDALLWDRLAHFGYFAPREQIERFLSPQAGSGPAA